MKLNYNGFSLLELLIVIAIIGISAGIASLSFTQWTRKTNVEKETKEILTDLNTARMESIFRKTRHSIVMNTDGTGYVFKRYSSPDEPSSAGSTVTSRTVDFLLTKENGNNFVVGDRTFMFDIRGMTNDLNTIRVNAVGSGSGYDCIVIHTARTNIGRMEGTSCVQK